jgi:hypothetical protein
MAFQIMIVPDSGYLRFHGGIKARLHHHESGVTYDRSIHPNMDYEALSPRHIQMRRQYDRHRYTRHLSQPELDRRIRDIFLNLLVLTHEAKIGLPPINDESAVWMEKWAHVLEEMQLRHGPFPAGFTRNILHSEPFPNLVSALAQKAAEAFKKKALLPGSVLIKYGKREHMENLFHEGRLRIQPASYYTRKDLNGAVRDDERRLPLSFALGRDDIKKIVLNPQDVPEVTPDRRVDVVFQSPADYWMYCLTESVEPRLFVDFEADACVISRDRQQFADRLRRAAQILGRARCQAGPVEYVDPLLPKRAEIFLPMAKHFGYAYQAEYRFCWFPVNPVPQLQPVDLSIGGLEDIAELITL